MPESVYKVIELVGTSTESWERAANAATSSAGASQSPNRPFRRRYGSGRGLASTKP